MRARRSIAVMLAEEQPHVTAVDPHEQRCVLLETGLELDRESEIVEVEFARLRLIKHPQNWNDLIKIHRCRSHDGFNMLWLVRFSAAFGAKLTASKRMSRTRTTRLCLHRIELCPRTSPNYCLLTPLNLTQR